MKAPRTWTWWGALLLVAATLVAQVVAGIVTVIPLMIAEVLGYSAAEQWLTPVITFASMITVLGLLLIARRWSGAKPLWDRRDLADWKNWLLALGALVISAGANVVRIFVEKDPAAPALNEQILALAEAPGGTPWAPLLMLGTAVVILAPLTEEWVFRGILLPALQRATGRRWAWLGAVVGVSVSSLIFGLLHWPVWWVPAVYGLAIGLLSLRQRSLALPFLVHGAINLTVFILVLTAS
jgi:membrane protease YdiL (CAAX protease family)